jgi:heptosyltransferase II
VSTLVIKLNATGDVVRTTVLLRKLSGPFTWITADGNLDLMPSGIDVRTLAWSDRDQALDQRYDCLVNLEDDPPTAEFGRRVGCERRFGACLRDDGSVGYSDDSRAWFDMSLISVFGRHRADELKLLNRRTYQELIFEGLGLIFEGERYVITTPVATGLTGDVAIAPVAGPVWPMKGWAYYDLLKTELERAGLQVNVLPRRRTLREHLGDVSSHRCLVSGDSLPMHLALATNTPCVTLFNCTSPWEIYDYGVQTKLVSPLLERFFYKRGYDSAATSAIRLDDALDAVMERLKNVRPSRTVIRT